MGPSRFRVQAFDRKGNKFTISFEGRASREKLLQVLDMMELLGGLPSESSTELGGALEEPPSKLDRVKAVVLESFQAGWFSSKDLVASYEDAYGEALALSTASTYLQRLAAEGFLLRSGSRVSRRYRLNTKPENRLSQGLQAFRSPSEGRP
ncbi:MAG: hypothetical protein QW057_01715 [Candidatus Bathyarchaeia archaeon]